MHYSPQHFPVITTRHFITPLTFQQPCCYNHNLALNSETQRTSLHPYTHVIPPHSPLLTIDLEPPPYLAAVPYSTNPIPPAKDGETRGPSLTVDQQPGLLSPWLASMPRVQGCHAPFRASYGTRQCLPLTPRTRIPFIPLRDARPEPGCLPPSSLARVFRNGGPPCLKAKEIKNEYNVLVSIHECMSQKYTFKAR